MNIGALLRGRDADRRSRPGTRSASPISAIPASPSWRSRRSRRATSTGRRRANGSIYAKVAFEKYFLRKIRRGESEPFYERFLLDKLNIAKVKEVETSSMSTSRQIVCGHCGKINRLPAERALDRRALRILPPAHLHRPPDRGRRSGLRPPCGAQRYPGARRRLGAVVRPLPRDGADVRARRHGSSNRRFAC